MTKKIDKGPTERETPESILNNPLIYIFALTDTTSAYTTVLLNFAKMHNFALTNTTAMYTFVVSNIAPTCTFTFNC